MSGLREASRHVYGPQTTARSTGTSQKRQHCNTPVSSFVVRCNKVAISLRLHCQGKPNNCNHADSARCCRRRRSVREDTLRAAKLPIS
ncbi:hypothetical protein TNCV_2908841 [Trichonephila clavipes]|nr:hypothetical protein TNCV_2908841 [Trichonephila clavipes]